MHFCRAFGVALHLRGSMLSPAVEHALMPLAALRKSRSEEMQITAC